MPAKKRSLENNNTSDNHPNKRRRLNEPSSDAFCSRKNCGNPRGINRSGKQSKLCQHHYDLQYEKDQRRNQRNKEKFAQSNNDSNHNHVDEELAQSNNDSHHNHVDEPHSSSNNPNQSNALFKFENQQIRSAVDDFGEMWFFAVDVAIALGYANAHNINDIVSAKFIKTYGCWRGVEDKIHPHTKLLCESGLYQMILRSQKLSKDEKEKIVESFQKKGFLMKIHIPNSRKEIEFKAVLEQFCDALNIIVHHQKSESNYRMDFYLPDIDLVIEYDENCHRDYDQQQERQRENTIRSNTKCDILRLSDEYHHAFNLGKITEFLMNRNIDTN